MNVTVPFFLHPLFVDSSSESSDSDSSSSSSSDEESKKKKKKARHSSDKSKKELNEQEKLKAAIEKQKKQKEVGDYTASDCVVLCSFRSQYACLQEAERQLQLDERKQKYNVNYDDIRAPTQYDMEAYALTDKYATSDPMAAYMNKKKDK